MDVKVRSVGGAKPGAAGGLCSCLTVAYYQPYFDVDTVRSHDLFHAMSTPPRPLSFSPFYPSHQLG